MRKRGRPRKTDPRYRPRGSRDDGSGGEGTQPQARGTDSSDPGRGEDSLLPSPHKRMSFAARTSFFGLMLSSIASRHKVEWSDGWLKASSRLGSSTLRRPAPLLLLVAADEKGSV
jgi:hypothetical protein